MWRFVLLLVLAVGAAAWVWKDWQQPPPGLLLDNGAYLTWGECWFDTPLLRPVHCGRLHTRLEPGQKPQSFALPVVRVAAWPWRRERPPVVYAAGGPGGATGLESRWIGYWFDWVSEVDWPADIIFYDQRGVGLSQPSIDCQGVRDVAIAMAGSDLPTEQQYRALSEAQQQCSARLVAEGWNLNRFDSQHNADDLLDLVATLGLEQWQLYGVSYGTRLALQVMRRQPSGLQAVVLDSVYPPQRQGERADTPLLNRALALFARSCERLATCDAPHARLQAALQDAMLHLRHTPERIVLREPGTGRALSVLLNEDDLPWLIFESQYSWDNLDALPSVVESLADGHVSPALRELLQASVDQLFDDSLSTAVGNSVDCRDNGPFSETAFKRQLHRYPLVAQIKQFDWQYHPCRQWPVEDAGAAQRQPVSSDVPVLLLSGEFDPVTPPEWAEQAARTLPNSDSLIFPGIGHGALDSDACAMAATRAFLSQPEKPRVSGCLSYLW